MENLENILNNLVASLLQTGFAEFSQEGLDIKASLNNGCLKINATQSSKEDKPVNELSYRFEEYIKSLDDTFFVEVVESFAPGELKEIQNKLDSTSIDLVREGIAQFMHNLKELANNKIENINKDIDALQKDIAELEEIKGSYEHVLQVQF